MEGSQALWMVFLVIVGIFALGTMLSGFFQVHTAEAVVVQRMGKFERVASAGINFKLPWLDQIAGRIDLRVQQLALDVETKTKDNVFVKIPVSVQYHVIPDHVYEAFYKLANPQPADFLLRLQRDSWPRAQDESRRRISSAIRHRGRDQSKALTT